MDPILSCSSRQLRRICRNSPSLKMVTRATPRTYTTASTFAACRPRTSHTADCRPQPAQSRITSTHSRPNSTSTAPPSSPPKNHYELFPKTLPAGPPPSGPFPINVRQLRQEFLQLQASAHPDKHPPELKARAEATSSLINEAYKTLQNPLLRAQYLLSLQAIDVAEDETLKIEDPELLMEVLEAREEIEDATEEKDLEAMRERNEKRVEASEGVLGEAFARGDLDAAKGEAVRLRYWVNIRESLDNWEKGAPVVLQH